MSDGGPVQRVRAGGVRGVRGAGRYREALLAAGAQRVHLAGAGPALFALAEDEAGAGAIRDKVSLRTGVLVRGADAGAAESLRREG